MHTCKVLAWLGGVVPGAEIGRTLMSGPGPGAFLGGEGPGPAHGCTRMRCLCRGSALKLQRTRRACAVCWASRCCDSALPAQRARALTFADRPCWPLITPALLSDVHSAVFVSCDSAYTNLLRPVTVGAFGHRPLWRRSAKSSCVTSKTRICARCGTARRECSAPRSFLPLALTPCRAALTPLPAPLVLPWISGNAPEAEADADAQSDGACGAVQRAGRAGAV